MTHEFGREGWENHWRETRDELVPANPYVARETAGLTSGTALDAGCGAGAEAIWLAQHGWRVTGADISATVLAAAESAAASAGVSQSTEWIEADLTTWQPEAPFDLVMTNYAHATIPQLELYARISGWVAPGGTLLIVGHQHGSQHRHGGETPEEATVTAADITALFAGDGWAVETADEVEREVVMGDAHVPLRDVVVRVTRAA
jgi:SAM-dependent methyltransferase